MEFGNSAGGTMTALAILLAVSNGRGGGDLNYDGPIVGRWGGDRIAIIGDYAEDDDVPRSFDPDPSSIYSRCIPADRPEDPSDIDASLPRYRDISPELRKAIEADGTFCFEGETGWIRRVAVFAERAEPTRRPDVRPDLVVGRDD